MCAQQHSNKWTFPGPEKYYSQEKVSPSSLLWPNNGYRVCGANLNTLIASCTLESGTGIKPVATRYSGVRLLESFHFHGIHREHNLGTDQQAFLAQEGNGALGVVNFNLRCLVCNWDLHHQTSLMPGILILSTIVIAPREHPVSHSPQPKHRIGSILALSILTSYFAAPN